MSPPLRPWESQEELWKGIAGGAIQVVATDHCPYNYKGQKDLGREALTGYPMAVPVLRPE
ncbi:hypothetical protein N752_25650 [Desulforamulus aquiferis]|nr:hypothetical protein N752_25650 [Desulforamulus aquiferis]